jgi:CRP/FNR family cyclic AMP-dependent transcriptional regulator
MSVEDQQTPLAAASWPPTSARPATPAAHPTLYAFLLDFDDELAAGLEVQMRFSAHQQASARVLEADIGEWDLSPWFQAAGPGPGLLIIEGLLASETRVAGRTVTALLGRTDLLQPPENNRDDMIGGRLAWRVLVPAKLALLDAGFLDRVQRWPQISSALYRRAGHLTADIGMLRAISAQPKLEVRLVLMLWHLAARWGRVEPTGIRISLPLTHRLLGQLVAAERPSISHALGIVTGVAGDWHLHGSIDDHLQSLMEQSASTVTVRPRFPPASSADQTDPSRSR